MLDPDIALARAVADGLASHPKRIPSRYLYDALGSQLFEAICELPWYKITRGERILIRRHADSILGDLRSHPTLVELGAGNGEKLALLLDSCRALDGPIAAHVVDISPLALELSARTLARHPRVTLVTHEATYETGLRSALAEIDDDVQAMLLFLGSNIGNMAPDESDRFLRAVRDGCRVGDRFLLGADLIKPEAELLLAYDDPLGVSAAFNKNLLVRLNRELDGDFDLDAFDHHVVWNPDASRVEAYLVSRSEQLVCLRGAGCCVHLSEGEAIWTESSHKYALDDIVSMATRARFSVCQQWVEPESSFALTLLEASGSQ